MLALFPALALAQEPPPPPPPPAEEADHYYELAFTLGPLLGLTLPGVDEDGLLQMVNLQIEARQGEKAGVGLIGGFGRVDDVLSWELGLAGRGYPVGDFDTGLVLGAEITFVHQSRRAGGIDPESGLAFGPVLGFKYTAPFGLTFEATGGAAAQFYGTGFDTAQNDFGPLAHVQLGWSL